MQTFLPYPDFARSAACLDRKRLGKQRVEVLQLLRGQFPNHPAAKMWRGYEYQLANYGLSVCYEWLVRGYRDTCGIKISIERFRFVGTGLPPWFGDEAFHRSHQSNLIRKLPSHYGPLFPGVPDDLPYVWTVR